MGTRADFYVGRGKDAEWLGSIAWDGYPTGITPHGKKTELVLGERVHVSEDWPEGGHLFEAKTPEEFRSRLERFFQYRTDVTRPADGWPWPWEDSQTTDYAYAFDDGAVYACPFGHAWFKATDDEPEDLRGGKDTVFPNMKDRQKVTLGKRSGVLIFGT